MPTTSPTTVRVPPDVPVPPDATELLRAIWQRHQVRVGERVELIERAAHALGHGQLDASLQQEALRAAHMLAGSLGTFGFAQASRAAHELEGELERVTPPPADPQPQHAVAMAELLAQVRSDLEAASEQQRASKQQRSDQQDHERLADEQTAFVAPVA